MKNVFNMPYDQSHIEQATLASVAFAPTDGQQSKT